MEKIKIGIVGYGNLGRGAEVAVQGNRDMELVGIFTRRPAGAIKPVYETTEVYHIDQLLAEPKIHSIDVLVMCGGSATDLGEQSPMLAKRYNLVDSFDTHARIPEHFAQVDQAAKEGGNTAIISVGWDPGLFSLNRLYAEAVLPLGETQTFWGKGVSQGHSDALRRIPGVLDAIQYTIPIEETLAAVREGTNGPLTSRDKHLRECFVVIDENVDPEEITRAIVTMPNYFSDYNTTVNFISKEELMANE